MTELDAGAISRDLKSLIDERDRLRAEVAERLRQFNAAKDQRDAAQAEADELRRQLLDETYRPEGGEIVMRELGRLRAELAEVKAENESLFAQTQALGGDLELEGQRADAATAAVRPDRLFDAIYAAMYGDHSVGALEREAVAQLAEGVAAALASAATSTPAESTVYDEIRAERTRAHAKHGRKSMESGPATDPDGRRFRILVEEVGEVAREFNDAEIEERRVDLAKVRKELIQTAAMAAAWADACGAAD